MNNYSEQAKNIVADNIYMTIATASEEGKPWVSPVFFAYDEKYNLYWVSNKAALHSKLIRLNNNVAMVIFDSSAPEGEGDGVYFEAVAEEMKDSTELKNAMNLLNDRMTVEKFKINDEDVSENGEWRVYKATPVKITKLTEGRYINGQYIDERTEVKLV